MIKEVLEDSAGTVACDLSDDVVGRAIRRCAVDGFNAEVLRVSKKDHILGGRIADRKGLALVVVETYPDNQWSVGDAAHDGYGSVGA